MLQTSRSASATLVDLLSQREADQGQQLAYRFLRDEDGQESLITYGELARQAKAIGAWLQSLDLAGERVLLLYPSGIDYIAAFFGCQMAGAVAVPAYPPRANKPMPRIQAILADAGAKAALTTAAVKANVQRQFDTAPSLKSLQWLASEETPAGIEATWQPPSITPDSLSFLQYTSGSTGDPKGVMVSHGNLIHNLHMMQHGLEMPDESMWVTWLPMYHDMGLIGSILEPMYMGGASTMLSPVAFLQRPASWLQAITRYRGVISGAPNFAYELCVERVSEEQKAALDLSSWRLSVCAAEPVRHDTLRRFYEAFASCGLRSDMIYPGYGLAENTLQVTGGYGPGVHATLRVDRTALANRQVQVVSDTAADAQTFVGCGTPRLDQDVVIVDPERHTRCAAGEVGEIWTASPSVAKGYWNRPELTRDVFEARLADTVEGPYLRTGDLGFLHENELYIAGRLKDLIIIRGRNLYPQEIELTVERAHPALRPTCGAAFSIELDREEHLVVVQELDRQHRNVDTDEVITAIRRAVVEEHEVQPYAIVLIRTLTIPKTSSGKIQRSACKQQYLDEKLEVASQWVQDLEAVRAAPIDPSTLPADAVTLPTAESSSIQRPVIQKTEQEIQDWLSFNLSSRLGIPAADFDVRQPFTTLGLDSVQMVSLIGDLEKWLGRSLAPTMAWDYPTTLLLARHLSLDPNAPTQVVDNEPPAMVEPIAVVGMGCRFPGAPDLASYWRLMAEKGEGIREIPADRWNAADFYDANLDAPGKMGTRWGGFLHDIDQFDPRLFGITPREASRMDPQQRLLLEVAWEAFEHAGLSGEQVSGSRTGVFVGIGGTDYSQIYRGFPNYQRYIDAYCGTGNALSIAANRLSYIYDLRGPSLAVDTACSSALVSLHYAVQSLRNHECDMALTGGVNVILTPETTIAFSKARMLSPDGRCKPFDSSANGYVRGEGCGLVVLKRLGDALKNGDNILALIRGTAVNQDGKTSGMTAPNGPSQQECIRKALHQASVTAEQLTYVEAHGTGTPLGDPIEVGALQAVIGQRGADAPLCYMGSVKANIGHLETASGVASLIKVVLMLQHGEIPPQRNFKEINPNIPNGAAGLTIPTELTPWPESKGARLASISGFGFGGTNSHVVLEESPIHATRPAGATERPLHAATFSAASTSALREVIKRHAEHLAAHPELPVADVCHTLNTGRTHLNERLSLVAESTAGLVTDLNKFVEKGKVAAAAVGTSRRGVAPKIGFLFTGQGSQYVGMASELYASQPLFRRTLDDCNEILQPLLDRPLLSVLFDTSEDPTLIDQTGYTQPALFAIEYAIAKLWQSWGVQPHALLGHSVGEYPAACIAGVFSLEAGLKLIAERGRRMQSLPQTGLMAAVLTTPDRVTKLLARYGKKLSIAAVNGPEMVVISGDDDAVRAVMAEFAAQDVACQLLTVSHAFHSSHLDPMLDGFEAFAKTLEYQAPQITLISNLTGRRMVEGELPDAHYWRRHTRESVYFLQGMAALAEAGCEVFLEVGPQPVLTGMGKKCVADDHYTWLPSLRKGYEDWRAMFSSLGQLHVRGVPVDWRAVDKGYNRSRVALPTYPFERSRFWMEPTDTDAAAMQSRQGGWVAGSNAHPLLGERVPSALAMTQFLQQVSVANVPYLKDHQVQGSIVFPGSGYLEMATAAARELFGPGVHSVENVNFQQALFMNESQTYPMQIVVSPEVGGRCSFQIYHLPTSTGESSSQASQAAWVMHAEGTIRRGQPTDAMPAGPAEPLLPRGRTLDEELDRAECVSRLRRRGLEYGPTFQCSEQLWRSDGESVAILKCHEAVTKGIEAHEVHPALLDACFQVIAAAVPADWAPPDSGETYLPMGVSSVRVFGRAKSQLTAHARIEIARFAQRHDVIEGDVTLYGDNDEVLADVVGLKLRHVGKRQEQDTTQARADWLYETRWQVAELPEVVGDKQEIMSNGRLPQLDTWLILSDTHGVGARLSRRLEARGHRCLILTPTAFDTAQPDVFRQRVRDLFAGDRPACRGIVHLWNLDIAPTEKLDPAALEHASALGCESTLALVQEVARLHWSTTPRLFLVTRGAQHVDVAPVDEDHGHGGQRGVAVGQSLAWGFGSVVAVEHPELACTLVDLDPGYTAQDNGDIDVVALLAEITAANLPSHAKEQQVSIRGRQRLVRRLVHAPAELINPEEDTSRGNRLTVPKHESFRLEFSAPGNLSRLALRPFRRTSPAVNQVEIEVGATGLNFSDVLKALGLYPGITDTVVPMGIECGGRISAVGPGVTRFKVGDPVLAIAPFSFASHTITHQDAVVHKPASLSDAEAATIPITFLTAHYGLVRLAHIEPGERVLIHAGAGGVGLAALQICQKFGCEVFATAGSETKREFLRQQGVKHVFDSRSLSFVEEILALTNRQGVDVVLNSLPGEAIPASLGLLRAYGRFLEIGKVDIYQNRLLGMYPFQNNLSFHAIDLDRMLREKLNVVRSMFLELMESFERGEYRALPLTNFPVSQVIGAYRYMQQRKNIGKVVVSLKDVDAEEVATPADDRIRIRPDAAYLITGGLGALGLEVARSLVAQGAKHLLLSGRTNPSAAAQLVLDELVQQGVSWQHVRADVADQSAFATALKDASRSMPPVRGVIHAAGLLDDGVVMQLDSSRLRKVLAPKVRGAWNLHQLTHDAPLDFFVLFSSVACLFGSPGQANYAAGNAFLDALAHERRRQGLTALSINWGPWAEIGMAVRSADAKKMAEQGLAPLPPIAALQTLDKLIASDAPQVGVVDVDWERLGAQYPAGIPSLLRELAVAKPAGSKQTSPLRAELMTLGEESRREFLVDQFVQQLARVMEIEPEKIDPQVSLTGLGLDSLMVIELKNIIESSFDVSLPIARFLEGPSVVQLAGYTLEAIAGSGATATASTPTTVATSAAPTEFALSQGQAAMWYLYRFEPASPAYNVWDGFRLNGDLDLPAMQRSLQTLFDRHPMLRATFHEVDGRPVQRIDAHVKVPLQIVDAAEWDAKQQYTWLQTEAHRPFDLEQGPNVRIVIMRLAPDEHVLVFILHHIVTDLWSLLSCISEMAALYRAEAAGQPITLPPLEAHYADFVQWQNALPTNDEGRELLAYWQQELAGELPVLNLPTDRPRPPVQTFRGTTEYLSVGPEITERLKQLSKGENTTFFTTLLAAYQVLLHRYTGQVDVLVGTPTSGRSQTRFISVTGDFINPVVVRGNLAGDPKFTDFLALVRQKVLSAMAHQDLPFSTIVEHLRPDRDLSRSPVFQTVFVMRRSQGLQEKGMTNFLLGETDARVDLGNVEVAPLAPIEQQFSQFDLSLQVAEADGRLSIEFQYNTDLFDRATITHLAEHYRTLLASIAESPDAAVSQLPLLAGGEVEKLRETWNDTACDYPRTLGIHQWFEQQASHTPEAVAVIGGDERLTYRELNARANQLAHHLRSAGVAADTLVGICVDRTPEMLVGLLGILKAGAAYLPLDPSFPAQRLALMVEDSQVSLIVAQQRLVDVLPAGAARMVLLDVEAATIATQPMANLDLPHAPERRAYVLYTSGSTGRPKGVELPHRAVVNFLNSMSKRPGLAADDTLLAVTTLSFDIAVLELFLPLVVGAKVVIATRDDAVDGQKLAALMDRHQVTLFQATPATWRLLLSIGWQGRAGLKMLCGGEALPRDLASELVSRGELWNMYGPTETTVWSTIEPITAESIRTGLPISIGRPIDNTQVYVLDQYGELAPSGVAGELCIGGDGVAIGYLMRPELTAERFIADRFSDRPEARLYRTGDLARWLTDGRLECLGRIDQQVKIRGFRIELGEIETALAHHSAVAEAVVVSIASSAGDQRLVGYFVPVEGAAPSTTELQTFLRGTLPDYMVPAAIVSLAALPRTPNGKIDRKALPRPETLESAASSTDDAPQTPTEERVARIWRDVLDLSHVGRHDDFFLIGGHSLRAAQLISQLRSECEVEIPLRHLFESPTVAGVSRWIDAARGGSALPEVAVAAIDFAAEATLDADIMPPSGATIELDRMDRVLLTGATGYLGAFLLDELLHRTDATVYCLVRAKSADEAMAKLRNNLATYQLDPPDVDRRVVPVLGDLARPRLGLADETFTQLAESIDTIYHNGALVNFVYPYHLLRAANVGGTQEVLRLASRSRVKPVHFVSTFSVHTSPERHGVDVIHENDALPSCESLHDGYSQSKWVAEKLINAAQARGLPTVIYRPGRITGHSQTGVANTSDFMHTMIAGCLSVGAAPQLEVDVDMTPVDFVSRAIVALARQPASVGKTFHLLNPQPPRMDEVVDFLRSAGYRLESLSFDAWRDLLEPQVEAFAPLFNGEGTSNDELHTRLLNPRFDCRNVIQGLRGQGIECPAVDGPLLNTYLSYLAATGFVPPPDEEGQPAKSGAME